MNQSGFQVNWSRGIYTESKFRGDISPRFLQKIIMREVKQMIVITYKDKCRKKIVEKAFEFPYQARLL